MIDGLATDTMVASTRIMKKPTSIAHRACHGFAGAAAVAGASGSGDITSTYSKIQPTLRIGD